MGKAEDLAREILNRPNDWCLIEEVDRVSTLIRADREEVINGIRNSLWMMDEVDDVSVVAIRRALDDAETGFE